MFFEPTSFAARNAVICQFPKGRARAEREALVYLA
jgi:hypothetical protein